MMTTLIILAYVANVFLNRWLNKKLLEISHRIDIEVWLWFWSLCGTVYYLFLISCELYDRAPRSILNYE